VFEIHFADDAHDFPEIDNRQMVEPVGIEYFLDFQKVVIRADRHQVFVVGHKAGDGSKYIHGWRLLFLCVRRLAQR
jgi:hypothetical protein